MGGTSLASEICRYTYIQSEGVKRSADPMLIRRAYISLVPKIEPDLSLLPSRKRYTTSSRLKKHTFFVLPYRSWLKSNELPKPAFR